MDFSLKNAISSAYYDTKLSKENYSILNKWSSIHWPEWIEASNALQFAIDKKKI